MRAARPALAALALWLSAALAHAQTIASPGDLAVAFTREVDRRLDVPAPEQTRYAAWLAQALVLVDRSAFVQAVMVWWVAPQAPATFIGASPTSTGRPSGLKHFETPLGVFEHSLANLDFRAEGTINSNGIRGYGHKGMRVFDFGWVIGQRGWAPGEQAMRLQLHATDRERLEPRLGERASKGCIRIPATLNTFIDRYGLLDAAYEEAMAAGREFWVLRGDRTPTPWPGRYLVVIESPRSERPAWSPAPGESVASIASAGLGSC